MVSIRVRIATFNILHGRSLGDGARGGQARECMRRLDADVLALQEVDLVQARSALADLTALAAETMGAASLGCRGHRGHPRRDLDGGHRTRTARRGRLRHRAAVAPPGGSGRWCGSADPTKFPMYLREPNKVLMVHEEPRAAMVAQLDTPLGPMTVANTHLSFVPGWNRVSCVTSSVICVACPARGC